MNDLKIKSIDKTLNSENSNATIDTAATYNSRMKKRKIIVLGKFGVGKSSILNRFLTNSMASDKKQMQDEIFTKNYFYKKDELKLTITDTPGQSEYTPGLPNKYCIGVHGYILCFAVDDNHSFEIIQHVNKILLESIGTKYVPRILVGNKTDLTARREVSLERIKKLSKELKCPYLECSALNGGSEIDKIINKLLKEVDKEANDEYPYDIRNSALEMNFILTHNKPFKLLLEILLVFLNIISLLYFVFTFLFFSETKTFSLFPIVNLGFSVFSTFICFRGLSSINKHIYHGMNSFIKGSYISLSLNFLMILLVLFFDTRPREIWPSYFFIDLIIFYVFSMISKAIAIVLMRNLQHLFKDNSSITASIDQKLLV